MTHKLIKTDDYLFVLEHSRIKRGDTVKYDNGYFTATHDNYHDSLMKIIAHLPLNGSPVLEGVDLLPPYFRHQEDGLEGEKYKYTEEEMRKALLIKHDGLDIEYVINMIKRYPTEFECEMVYTNSYGSEVTVSSYDVQSLVPKTITTAKGVQWLGKYK